MAFTEPESTGRLNPRDVIGHLLIVWPVNYIEHAPSKYSRPDKPSDAVVVDVVDLDLPDTDGNEGALFRGVWWRPSRLIQLLKDKIGITDPVLAWMDQGIASQGMNAPFILTSATGDPKCIQRAEAWIARHPEFQPNPAALRPGTTQRPDPEPPRERAISELEREATERLRRIAEDGAARLPRPPQGEQFPY